MRNCASELWSFGPSRNDGKPSLLRGLGPQPLFLLAQLGGERFAKIFRGKHLADFDLVAAKERRALHPLDRFIERLGVDQPEAGDEIARERKRTATDAALPAAILDPCALHGRMQALARLHHAGLHQLLVELAHRGQQFRARHHACFRVLAGLHNHHESHRHTPFWPVGPATVAAAFINKTGGLLRRRHVSGNYFADNCSAPAYSDLILRSRKAASRRMGRRPHGSRRAKGALLTMRSWTWRRSRSPRLFDERAIVVSRAEIDVDALHLVVLEDEEFGIAKRPAAPGDATIGDESFIAFDENPLQLVPFDPVATLPAAFEIGRLVESIVVGAGEAEIVAERVLDEPAIVGEIGCEDPADRLCPVCFGHSALLLRTLWVPSGNTAPPLCARARTRAGPSAVRNRPQDFSAFPRTAPPCCRRTATAPRHNRRG